MPFAEIEKLILGYHLDKLNRIIKVIKEIIKWQKVQEVIVNYICLFDYLFISS